MNLLNRNFKLLDFNINKNYEKKRRILEQEVNELAMKNLKIKELLEKIEEYEKLVSSNKNP